MTAPAPAPASASWPRESWVVRDVPFAHLRAFWISVYDQKSDAFSAIAPTIGAGRPYPVHNRHDQRHSS